MLAQKRIKNLLVACAILFTTVLIGKMLVFKSEGKEISHNPVFKVIMKTMVRTEIRL